jgi:hypothetical protein
MTESLTLEQQAASALAKALPRYGEVIGGFTVTGWYVSQWRERPSAYCVVIRAMWNGLEMQASAVFSYEMLVDSGSDEFLKHVMATSLQHAAEWHDAS